MVQRKRSQKKRSLRKRSLRKRSLRKRSRKRSQSGGGMFSWFKTVSQDKCEEIASELLEERSYTNPADFVFDYNLMIANQSGILGKSGHKLKSFLSILGYTGVIVAGMALISTSLKAYSDDTLAEKLAKADQKSVTSVAKVVVDNVKNDRASQVAIGATTLAVLAAIIHHERKKKKSQAKMILEVCANTWNNEYPNQKISTNDIKKMIKNNRHTRNVYKRVAEQTPSEMRHLVKHEQFMAKQEPRTRSPQTININLNYTPGEAHKLPGAQKLTM